MSNPTNDHCAKNIRSLKRLVALALAIVFTKTASHAATIVWSGASGVDTNWSDSANWVGGVAPGSADDVKFYDLGSNGVVGFVNNTVDPSFAGSIGSLQYGNTNGFHTTLIPNGQTLNLTDTNGLTVGTLTDNGNSQIVDATITGPGTLNLNNTAAVALIDQGRAANGNGTQRATLDMSGLASFTANLSAISVGSTLFGGGNNAQNATGTLKLAQTNVITTALIGSATNLLTSTPTNSIEIGLNNGNNGGADFLFLGQSNIFFIDSIGVGCCKTTASMLFNTGLNNPVAYFRGPGGSSSRVRFWTIGDMSSSGSSSSNCNGTNDFSGGTVDILVDTMSLGRDREGGNSGSSVTEGTLTFTAGTIDVNNIYIGNQQWTNAANSNPMAGVVNVAGADALLRVNSTLFLGRTSINNPAAQKTVGTLNVTNGTVLASTISVGQFNVTNFINMVNGTLIVSNTLATNASGLFSLSMSNSTLGFVVPANASLKALVKSLNTIGSTNFIQLDPAPVIFPVYPTNISLIRYTTWTGSNTFGIASAPAWAPNASVVSNGPNSTVDLSLPTDPRPIITGQPTGYSGSPDDDVTTNFAVVVADGSGAPLSYFWYYFPTSGSTNLLMDGSGPIGSSTIANSSTANMSLLNAQTGDNGNYFVVVSNLYGSVTSSVVVLNISGGCVPPSITGPDNQIVIQGNNATFTASVSANPAPYLQWQRGGVNIPGANGSTLIVTNVQYPADDQAVFSLIATNNCGDQTNSAILTVIVPPAITNQPVSLVVTNTQSASFSVLAGGVPAPTYQWYQNTVANPIPNATNATFSIASASPTNTATYFVIVANAAGLVTSSNATLTVNSTMSVVALSPANNQTGVCYDTPLYITFDRPAMVNTIGKISIYNNTNPATPVDTIDMTEGTLQTRTVGGENFATYPVIITGNQAAIYPHAEVLNSNQTYYVTVDNGVFADTNGAYFAGITATNIWQFTTKAGGPANPTNILVAQDYSGDFATVQGALDSLPANNTTPTTIYANNGVYTEIVNFHSKNNILLRGQSRNGVIIGYANNSTLNNSTHFRMAVKVNANDIDFDDLTLTNMTPQDFSQAEALMIESGAQSNIVNNCNIDSTQDTILANISTSKAYFNNSLIQGDVDFIWGGGNLFFTNCEVRWLIRAGNAAALGPNPSPTSSDISSNGFSFVNCRLTTLPGANPADVVGRTRGITNGNTVLINCFVSTNIGGWYSDALPTNEFRNWYFNCTNDLGALAALSNGIALSPSDPNVALASNVTNWLYGWAPQLGPNILTQPTNLTVTAGATATFSVSATGVPDATYQWLQNGTNAPYPTANSSTLIIPNAQSSEATTYSVIVSNTAGAVTSTAVTLTVIIPAPPTINGNPQTLGDGNVQFSFSGTEEASYRVWATTNIALTPITSTWTLIGSGVFSSAPVTFTDTYATNFPNRFYIISSP